MIMGEWWAWLALGAVLATLEIFAPGFVLLGFAAGASVIALLVAITGPEGPLVSSLPLTVLIFAILSLIATLGFRKAFRTSAGEVKTFERDINQN